jgi:predicted DNA-binding protein
METTQPHKVKVFSIRLDPDTQLRLKALADAEYLPEATYLRRMVHKLYEARQRKGGGGE